jgi:hypothetical protein
VGGVLVCRWEWRSDELQPVRGSEVVEREVVMRRVHKSSGRPRAARSELKVEQTTLVCINQQRAALRHASCASALQKWRLLGGSRLRGGPGCCGVAVREQVLTLRAAEEIAGRLCDDAEDVPGAGVLQDRPGSDSGGTAGKNGERRR